ncbi:hypothetical protein CBS101457_002361 [Exobasidium rhododendri]|nr:hypothetical protein CBS101457_002361 [Exobasidium rhododendri]
MTVDATATTYGVSESASVLRSDLLQLLRTVSMPATAESIDTTERLELLSSSISIFSQLRSVTRIANDDSRTGKRKVAEARLEVDDRSLALQNLKYQKRHLEEEIRMCRDFRSIYQTIPLTDLDDFKTRAPTEDTQDSILENTHTLQLARLRFELSERKRLEAEKQLIQAERGSLIKENKVKKQRLERLEADLKEILVKSDAIGQHFEELKSEVNSDSVSPSAAA